MIETLKKYHWHDDIGYPPDKYELVNKINELVDAVNRMERQIEKLQCDD